MLFAAHLKKNAYFTDLEEQTKWESENGNCLIQICHGQKNLFSSNGFWIRPYEGTFYRPISIHVFGHWFGQHTHLPASYPINHVKEAMSTKELVYIHTVNAEKVSPSHFSLPAAWARALLWGCAAGSRSRYCLARITGATTAFLVTLMQTKLPTMLAKMLLIILMSIQNEQFSAPCATSCTN